MDEKTSGFRRWLPSQATGIPVAMLLSLSLVLQSNPSVAHDMEGVGVKLHSATMSGGGAIDPGNSGATFLDTTIGQSDPLGSSTGADGTTLRAGFWPAIGPLSVPEPSALLLELIVLATLGALVQTRRKGRIVIADSSPTWGVAAGENPAAERW